MRSGFSGPRFEPVEAAPSYEAAEGRDWKYCGSAWPSASWNDCPMRVEPTTAPSAERTSEPFAWNG
ncbi:MAG: hypothetical protein K0S70_3933, partial [Microbacterium sp.]|nr:hypothetical protein [Microbacterium sp.]